MKADGDRVLTRKGAVEKELKVIITLAIDVHVVVVVYSRTS